MRNEPLIDEEKEKAAIEWENKVLSYLMPSVGLAAFVIGLLGFILLINSNIGLAIFLLLIALLGAGGIAYGVVVFIKKRRAKLKKEEVEPDER